MTNSDAIKRGFIPCETDHITGTLSYTQDLFHGSARVTVESNGVDSRLHVCMECMAKYHSGLHVRNGIKWE